MTWGSPPKFQPAEALYLISRKEARAEGLLRYFNGELCKNGHIAERLVSSCGCVICHAKDVRDKGRLTLQIAKAKNNFFKRTYGITPKEFDDMLWRQGYKCLACGDKFQKVPNLDHNHKTGKIRGIICRDCNIGLGMFKDNIDRLYKAIEYLRKYDGVE